MFKLGYVTAAYPKLTAAMSAYEYSPELEAKYTFNTPFDEQVCGAIRQGNTLWVPRESVPYAHGGQDFRIFHTPSAIDCTFNPLHEQGELCERSLALLRAGQSHIFEAPTGHGKTVEGGYITASFGQPTLIVVTKEDLMAQWKDALTRILKIPPSKIGHIQGDIADWKGKRIVLGMVQSLIIPNKYPAEMFNYFGLLVLDEVHQMAADCFIRVCQNFPAKLRLGFSATPTRKDGKTRLLHWHIGPVAVKGHILSMKPRVLVRQTGWKIPSSRQRVGSGYEYLPIPHGPGRMTLVYKAMASNLVRNNEIVNFTLQAYKQGRITLILSDLKESHLNPLFLLLTNAGIPGNDVGYYIGGMSKADLELTKTRKVVLGTYKMCSTGTNVPHWDTLVMATPHADIKQSVGRVLRHVDGKRQPVVLDLVDHNAIFQNFHLARCKQYYSIGAEIVKVQ